MGDRTTTFYKCNCGGEIEEYDAPSCMLFSASCDKCGWKDNREYYELKNGSIILCTEEEYKKFNK